MNKNTSAVSIVIPIYNMENKLEKCIDSVLKSTLKEIEIILVNDGSLDKSGEICENYKMKDKRIRTIHKKNGGISSARNAGMKIAKGKYIGFVDPDDTILPEMFEKLFTEAEQTRADCVNCNFTIISKNSTRQAISPLTGCYLGKEIKDEILLPMIGKRYKNVDFICCVWNKLYLLDTIRNNHISFREEIRHTEDILFNAEVFSVINKIVFISDELYEYYKNEGTLSSTFHDDEIEVKLFSYDVYTNLLPAYYEISERNEMIRYFINSYILDCAKRSIGIKLFQCSKRIICNAEYRNAYLEMNSKTLKDKVIGYAMINNNLFVLYVWGVINGLPIWLKQKIKLIVGM